MRALIISQDSDFTAMLSGILASELGLECSVAQTLEGELALDIGLIITDGQPFEARVPVLVLAPARAPYRVAELLARVRGALQAQPEEVAIGAYSFFTRSKELKNAANTVALTDREAELLRALQEAGEEGMSREALLKDVWGFEAELNTHTLETHIYRLRSKIRDGFGAELIEATSGGYRLIS